ncbi:hypothetical protein ACE83Q_05075 [Dellaglioa sp. P0083]|uniref:hypothetical protein n=1 Tax=Dellaglioa kimchii TaxID=3344667 RepID=UPI0038D44823
MSLGEGAKNVNALPYDVRLLLEERNIPENQMSWEIISDLFLESIATYTEFYGFNEDRRALFNDLKNDKNEANQIITTYKEYREWFKCNHVHFENLEDFRFLTICESIGVDGVKIIEDSKKT